MKTLFKSIHAFFTGLGIIGLLMYIALIIGAVIGWFVNIYKLCMHLPLLDMETLVRAIGVFIGPLGALFGWFL